MAAASADNLEHKAPVLLFGWSNQPISCFNMAAKANFLILNVKYSPATVNMATWKNMARPTKTPTTESKKLRSETHYGKKRTTQY